MYNGAAKFTRRVNEQTASKVMTVMNEGFCFGVDKQNLSEWKAVTLRAGLIPPREDPMLRRNPDTPLLPHYNL